MRVFAAYFCIVLISIGCAAHRSAESHLIAGLGPVHHPVSTCNADAQKYFDQGLALCYAFNHAEAVNSFRMAQRLDPNLAMAWWGEALALGPNINHDIDADAELAAYRAIRKAMSLAAKASPGMSSGTSSAASPAERAYIAALASRYTDDPHANLHTFDIDYRDAMLALSQKYPDDLDAATLFAESAMDLRPWQLWTIDGRPQEGTEQIVATLQSVLKRDPNHLGANHYLIHAVEASPHPELAMESARRLPRLAPGAGHLVHMPAHIYMRTGDYHAAVLANQQAAAVDENYISCCKPSGVYPMMYYSHNLHFEAIAACMSGESAVALAASRQIGSRAAEMTPRMPIAEAYVEVPLLVMVRFGRWEQILAQLRPDESMRISTAWSHFARGMAQAAKRDLPAARVEQTALAEAIKQVGEQSIGNNPAQKLLQIPTGLLAGRIAAAENNSAAAIENFRAAVAAQDALDYDEPPAFPIPVREALGAELLRSGDAAGAEAIFRKDLKHNPFNPRSLLGLAESLAAQHRDTEAAEAREQFQKAWRWADVPLALGNL